MPRPHQSRTPARDVNHDAPVTRSFLPGEKGDSLFFRDGTDRADRKCVVSFACNDTREKRGQSAFSDGTFRDAEKRGQSVFPGRNGQGRPQMCRVLRLQ